MTVIAPQPQPISSTRPCSSGRLLQRISLPGSICCLKTRARVGFKSQRPAHEHAGEMPLFVLAGRVIGVVIFSLPFFGAAPTKNPEVLGFPAFFIALIKKNSFRFIRSSIQSAKIAVELFSFKGGRLIVRFSSRPRPASTRDRARANSHALEVNDVLPSCGEHALDLMILPVPRRGYRLRRRLRA